jgi:membrane-associated phospholipid phosphatase
MHELLQLITDTGDLMVTSALTLGLFVLLWRADDRRAALGLAFSFAACLGIMTALKVIFVSCGEYWHAGIHSPSGHTSVSTVVYGALALVTDRIASKTGRFHPAAVLAALLVLAIGLSRILLHAHNPREVLVGLAVGLSCLALFAWTAQISARPLLVPPVWLLGLLVLVMLSAHGQHAEVEGLLQRWTLAARDRLGVCVRPAPPPPGRAPHPILRDAAA